MRHDSRGARTNGTCCADKTIDTQHPDRHPSFLGGAMGDPHSRPQRYGITDLEVGFPENIVVAFNGLNTIGYTEVQDRRTPPPLVWTFTSRQFRKDLVYFDLGLYYGSSTLGVIPASDIALFIRKCRGLGHHDTGQVQAMGISSSAWRSA